MKKISFQSTLLTIGTLCSLGWASANPAQAAVLIYDFQGTIDTIEGPEAPFSGLEPGDVFTEGSFTFDDSSITGQGTEYVDLTSISLSVSTRESVTDIFPVADAPVVYRDGEFQGLSIVAFSVLQSPDTFSISEGGFSYESLCPLRCNGASTGDVLLDISGSVTYAAVPEPFTILGAATAIGFGIFFKRKLVKR